MLELRDAFAFVEAPAFAGEKEANVGHAHLRPRALRPRGLRLRLGPDGIVGDGGVAFGSGCRFWRFEPRARQDTGLLENRVSDRADVRVDPAQIGDQIEM